MSSAEHERLLRRARAQDAALFRYRLIGPALEEGLTTKQRGRVVRGSRISDGSRYLWSAFRLGHAPNSLEYHFRLNSIGPDSF